MSRRSPRLARPAALALAATLLAPAAGAYVGASAGAQQTPGAEEEVRRVVTRLFDAMRTGDSAAVRALFHPRAMLGTALVREGRPEIRFDSVGAMVRSVGTPHPEPYDERLSNVQVRLDGPLAAVWTDYAFYVGTRFSHCGVDAFQLARSAAGWQIVALVDTRRRGADCPTQ